MKYYLQVLTGVLLAVLTASAQQTTLITAFTDQSDGTGISDDGSLITVGVEPVSGGVSRNQTAQTNVQPQTTEANTTAGNDTVTQSAVATTVLATDGDANATGAMTVAATDGDANATTTVLAATSGAMEQTSAQATVDQATTSGPDVTGGGVIVETARSTAVTTAADVATTTEAPVPADAATTVGTRAQTTDKQTTKSSLPPATSIGMLSTVAVTTQEPTERTTGGSTKLQTVAGATSAGPETTASRSTSATTEESDAKTTGAIPIGVDLTTDLPIGVDLTTHLPTETEAPTTLQQGTSSAYSELTTTAVFPSKEATTSGFPIGGGADTTARTATAERTSAVQSSIQSTDAPGTTHTETTAAVATSLIQDAFTTHAVSTQKPISTELPAAQTTDDVTTVAGVPPVQGTEEPTTSVVQTQTSSSATTIAPATQARTTEKPLSTEIPTAQTTDDKTTVAVVPPVQDTEKQTTSLIQTQTSAATIAPASQAESTQKPVSTDIPTTQTTAQVSTKPTHAGPTLAGVATEKLTTTSIQTQEKTTQATVSSQKPSTAAAAKTRGPTEKQQTGLASTGPLTTLHVQVSTLEHTTATTSAAEASTHRTTGQPAVVVTTKESTEANKTTTVHEKTTEAAGIPDFVDPKDLTKEQNDAVASVQIAGALPDKLNNEMWTKLKAFVEQWIMEWQKDQKERRRRGVTNQPAASAVSSPSSLPTTSGSAEPNVKMVGHPVEDKDSNVWVSLLAEDGKGGYVNSKDLVLIIENNKEEFETELDVKVTDVIEGTPEIQSNPEEATADEGSYYKRNKGVFIGLIVLGCVCLVVIIAGLVYILCTRRSHGGQHYLHGHDPEVAGVDNPVMVEKVNGANNPQKVEESEIVPYDSFTKEELESYEVEDTHL